MEASGLALSAAQTLLSAVQTLLAAIGSPELKQIFSKAAYLSELESLERTVSAVNAVLLDAQSQDERELSHYARDSIEKLKDVVYDADDLLDEFATLAKREHQFRMEGNEKSLVKVRCLFSRFKMKRVAYSMSRQVKKIREKLDQVADDATKFGFSKVDRQPIRSRVETSSYVHEDRVIGRELDKRRIADILCSNIQGNGPVLAIVGMGGLGKTALAQLVYNDDRIQIEFCDRRFWICVSDQDQSQFNTETILARVYKLAKGEGNIGDLALDPLVQEVRSILDQNKYLLVLDDVWTEDRIICNELMDILIGSGQMAKRGTRILVTTRSKKTATVLGCNHPYELQGLSDENSWLLFKIMSGIEQANCPDLVEMGKDIVDECAKVPLAIKVIGSFLNGQDKNTWQCIQQRGLSAIRKEENDIMPILKFSYYRLSPLLKTCFAYCALFPKDFKHEKEMLISLWMAHDYINQG